MEMSFRKFMECQSQIDEGFFRNLAMGAAGAALSLGALGMSPNSAQAAGGFTDNVKTNVQQRADQQMGFQMIQKGNGYKVNFDTRKMTDEQAMDRAMKRLPGGYDKWKFTGSGETTGNPIQYLEIMPK